MIIEIYSFLIFNTVLVLGINVPDDTHNDSDICMDKTLLNSCTKTCGESRCDMDSFCGEDGRCLYCSDAICKSMPIKYGCDISCAIRFTDKVYYSHAKKEDRKEMMFEYETLLTLLGVSFTFNVILVAVAAGLVCFLCRKRLLGIVRRGKKKSTSLVVNNSNLERQTAALVVTGRSWRHKKYIILLKDLPVVNIFYEQSYKETVKWLCGKKHKNRKMPIENL